MPFGVGHENWALPGVPTFVVGNQTLVGAQPYEQLEALVMSAGS